MLVCEEYFKRNYFESYSEFYLSLCIAAELGRRGTYLDMSTMRIEKNIIPTIQLDYFKYLVSKGYIKVGEAKLSEVSTVGLSLYFDLSFIDKVQDLFKVEDDRYVWEYDWCCSNYDMSPRVKNDILSRSTLGNSLLHIIAVYLMGIYFEDIEKKPLHIELDSMTIKSSYIYVNVISCCKTLDWFKSLVIVNTDLSEFKNMDLDYSIFFNNCRAANRYKKWSASEKIEIMKSIGMCVGSILVLWKRKGMCATNPAGKIVSSIIARVDEIGKDFIGVKLIPVNKTKEEVRIDFETIPDDKRYLFTDMLSYRVNDRNAVLSIYEVGIDNYFMDEYMLLTKIDTREYVAKRITVDDKESDVTMSNVDAIYWLLCEYEVDFDRELYRKMYNEDKPLMWDLYGEEN